LLRLRRPGRAHVVGAGLWCLLLSLACPSAALHASPNPFPAAADRADKDLSVLLAHVDRELAEIDGLLASSHFHTVLSVATSTRDLLNSVDGQLQLSVRRARLEVMVATAEIALGRRAVAQRSMMRALQAEPALSLDGRETSPKVMELLREAHRRSNIGPSEP
jgi:hypothetical protein